MTSDNIYIKIKMPNPSQEPTASSKAPNEDLKDMDVLCTFKIKIESQNWDHGCIKDQWPYPYQDQDAKPQSGISRVLQSSKWGLKGHDVLCTFKIKSESQNSDYPCIKDQWPYPKKNQDAKPQSWTSSTLQGPKWGLKGHGCSLCLHNQYREPKFGTWMYKRPVTISKLRSRCQTKVRNILFPPKPQLLT